MGRIGTGRRKGDVDTGLVWDIEGMRVTRVQQDRGLHKGSVCHKTYVLGSDRWGTKGGPPNFMKRGKRACVRAN